MIRVSGLHEQLEAAITGRSSDGLSADQQLRKFARLVRNDLALASEVLTGDLLPSLAEAGIRLLTWEQVDGEQRRTLTSYFESVVFPILTPLAFDPAHPFPFLSNLSLSLAVQLSDGEGRRPRFARVKVPPSLPRFVPLSGGPLRSSTEFILLEDLIEAHLDDLFPGMDVLAASAFRVTRDADIDVREEEASDLLRSVAENVRRRRFGAAVRLEIESGSAERVRDLLQSQLELDEDDVYAVDGALGECDLQAVTRLDRADLKDAPFVPASRALFSARGEAFDRIREGDVLLHHPYDSFDPVLRFLEDAAARSGRSRDQDDPLPDRRRLSDHRHPRPRRGEGQASRGLSRAPGTVRRREEHPLGARARASRRPRGLRRGGPEDSRQDRARRPPRGNDDAAIRPPRHRQLQPRDGFGVHRPRTLHGPPRVRTRRLRAVQLPDRFFGAAPFQAR